MVTTYLLIYLLTYLFTYLLQALDGWRPEAVLRCGIPPAHAMTKEEGAPDGMNMLP